MPPAEGRQWALVVLGTPLLLLGLVLAGYAGLFVVPGAPCGGGGDLTVPQTDVVVASNGSAVTVVHTGSDAIGGPTTDRVVVAVRDAESGTATDRQWIGSTGSLSRGDSLTITQREAGFAFTDADEVTVRWYGSDPDVAGFCPNGRTFGDLTRTQLRNASIPVESGSGE